MSGNDRLFLLKIKRFRSLNYVRYHPVSNRLTIVKHPFEGYEVGLHHIAFYTDTRDQVDQACELAKRPGAKVFDSPGEFPYESRLGLEANQRSDFATGLRVARCSFRMLYPPR